MQGGLLLHGRFTLDELSCCHLLVMSHLESSRPLKITANRLSGQSTHQADLLELQLE